MKQFLLLFAFLPFCSVVAQNKADQVKHIRQVYAEAKQMAADNGKNGKALLDMHILVNDGAVVDNDFELDDVTDLVYYFNKTKTHPETSFLDKAKCYLIIENWTSHGHTRYREFLFDPDKGTLLFVFMKSETDGGYIVETRYYYDAKGNVIDQKIKSGLEGHELTDNEPGTIDWNSPNSEKEAALHFLKIFQGLITADHSILGDDEKNGKATPKAERMAFIRKTYAEAKKWIEDDKKAELPRNIKVTIHDQTMENYAPETDEMNFYFSDMDNMYTGLTKHCYIIEDHRTSMYFDNYSEYLLDPNSHELIFSYSRGSEEGVVREWRYYFNENRKCIEAKSNAEEIDYGYSDKIAVKQYIGVFNELVK
jgi:hypothetical protein